jgi:hypothetical protein
VLLSDGKRKRRSSKDRSTLSIDRMISHDADAGRARASTMPMCSLSNGDTMCLVLGTREEKIALPIK